MSVDTKQKILEASIDLFNQNGITNVRLQHIADACGISIGNLVYHYKNKESIVVSIYNDLFRQFSEILSGYLVYTNLLDIDDQLNKYYDFFTSNHFYLTDIFEVERKYPEIHAEWQNYVNKMLAQIKSRIDYNIQRGIIIPQSEEMNSLLANNIWMAIIFTLPQKVMRGMPHEKQDYKESVWSQIVPYLTQNGQDEFVAIIYPQLVK